jgi:F-type H+-transporting ATPase subunit delta
LAGEIVLAVNTLQAKRYSQAIFQIALQRKELERWQSDLKRIAVIGRNVDLAGAIDNPRFSFEQKSRLLRSQLKDINPLALNLAFILINRGNFNLINEIVTAYQGLMDDFKGIDKAEIVTAVPLDENDKVKLVAYLESITGKKIVLIERVDPTIVGGLIARVGGKIVDGSTHSQLTKLRESLARAASTS